MGFFLIVKASTSCCELSRRSIFFYQPLRLAIVALYLLSIAIAAKVGRPSQSYHHYNLLCALFILCRDGVYLQYVIALPRASQLLAMTLLLPLQCFHQTLHIVSNITSGWHNRIVIGFGIEINRACYKMFDAIRHVKL